MLRGHVTVIIDTSCLKQITSLEFHIVAKFANQRLSRLQIYHQNYYVPINIPRPVACFQHKLLTGVHLLPDYEFDSWSWDAVEFRVNLWCF